MCLGGGVEVFFAEAVFVGVIDGLLMWSMTRRSAQGSCRCCAAADIGRWAGGAVWQVVYSVTARRLAHANIH